MTASSTVDAAPRLERSLGPFKLFAIAFGSIIGIGWITLVGSWLTLAGPFGAILAFGAGAFAVVLVGLAYAELALRFPEAGGEVVYAHAAFGRPLAFAVGWTLLMIYIGVIAFEAISVGWVLGDLWPGLLQAWPLWQVGDATVSAPLLAATLLATVGVAWANLRAANTAASLQVALMVLKIGVCVVFIAVAFASGQAQHLEPHFGRPGGVAWDGIASVFATSLLFYFGFNFLPQGLEERAPGVTAGQIVGAILASIVSAFVFYSLIILAIGMLLPANQLSGLNLPAADAFEVAIQSTAMRNLVLGAGLIGLISAWNGTLFAATRIVLLLGRERMLPRALARIDQRTGTPVVAIILLSAVALLLSLAGKSAAGSIVSVAVTGVPLTWTIVTAAALTLRRRGGVMEFRAPYGPLVFGLAFAISVGAVGIALKQVAESGAAARLGLATLVAWALLGVVIWLVMARQQRMAA